MQVTPCASSGTPYKTDHLAGWDIRPLPHVIAGKMCVDSAKAVPMVDFNTLAITAPVTNKSDRTASGGINSSCKITGIINTGVVFPLSRKRIFP